MPGMILVKRYRIARKGERGASVSIPPAFMEEMDLKVGDVLKAYREGEKLILIPEKAKEVTA